MPSALPFGAFAAIAAAGIAASSRGDDLFSVDGWPGPRTQRHDAVPNDSGPVVDTTPESKRARRRRLAKQGGTHGE